MEDVIPMHMD
jgi:hypothetical protein